MVDWDQVERLRSKGWDWSRISEDERVGFAADASGGDAGRQLRTLYYQRRSKAQRRGDDKPNRPGGTPEGRPKPPILLRIGYVLVPLFGLWTLLAFVFPSLTGLFVPYLYLLLALIVVTLVLLYALFQAPVKWERALRAPLIFGVVLGLVAAGSITVVALSEGCPNLSGVGGTSEPNGWAKYNNAHWQENGLPVFFFYGSIACPYCSASSWAMTIALQQFGSLSGQTLGHSAISDNPSNIPEVDLSSARLQSQFISLNVAEATDDTHVTVPSLGSCQTQAFVSTYSGGSIPFVVIDGRYVHASSSMVDPTLLQTNGISMTPTQVQDQIVNQSGPAWNAVAPAAFTMMAIMLKVSEGMPGYSALESKVVANYPGVSSQLAQLG
jgi:hypothetical protein